MITVDAPRDGTNGDDKSSIRAGRPGLALARLREGSVQYLSLLRDYRILFISGLVIFGLGSLLPAIPNSPATTNICASTMLCTHGTTPWGILTSVFLYDGWMNVPAYFLILVTYISFSDRVEPKERRGRANFALAISIASAVAANALWMGVLPGTFSWGPSGVIYALWGVLLAFTLFDGMPKQPSGLNPRTWYKDKKERGSAISNLVIFFVTAWLIFSQPAEFLSSGPGVNVFAHGVSFLGGLLATYAYRWKLKYQKRTNWS
ncbi:MAG: rhomboid family intramembrane serine protease [Nitrososphaerales archaeon]|jgi:membrane associated rhomboid family serine protease